MTKMSTALATLLGLVALAPGAAWAQGYYGYGPGMHGDWHEGWGGMIFGPIIMILFVAAIVVLVVIALRWLGGGPGPAGQGHRHGGRSPLEILEERFARGEIDKEEFEERRRALRS